MRFAGIPSADASSADCAAGHLAQAWLRQRQEQAFAVDLDHHQTLPALLHQPARLLGLQPVPQDGVGRADGRVAGEGQLAPRREDAQPVVGLGMGGRANEGRLGQIGPVRYRLHPSGRQVVAVEHHRHRVALEGDSGEHIDLAEGKASHGLFVLEKAAQSRKTPGETGWNAGSTAGGSYRPSADSDGTSDPNPPRPVNPPGLVFCAMIGAAALPVAGLRQQEKPPLQSSGLRL